LAGTTDRRRAARSRHLLPRLRRVRVRRL